jgi:uncharacterized protein (TIRG00374 family)
VGVAILILLYNHQNAAFQDECGIKGIPAEQCSLLQKVWTDFGLVNYWWILLMLLAFVMSNVSRAIRWNMLIKPLGYHQPKLLNSFFSIMIGYFANLGLPRLGEVLRAGSLAQYENIPVEKVMGTVVVDRLIDVFSILFVTAMAVLLQYQVIWGFVEKNVTVADKIGMLQHLVIYSIPLFLIAATIVWVFRQRLLDSSLVKKILNLAKGFWQGLQTVRKLNRPWWFVFHSILIWVLYYMMTFLCFQSFGPTAGLSMLTALVVFVAGGWGIVIPSPGGMGTYHFLAQTALSMYGVNGDDGFSWANISFFSIQLGGNVLIGLISLLMLPLINRNYHPKSIQAEHELS